VCKIPDLDNGAYRGKDTLGMRCRADKKAFEKWFVGWAGPPEDKEYPQYSEWIAFGHFAVLEQQKRQKLALFRGRLGRIRRLGYLNYDWLNREIYRYVHGRYPVRDFNDNSAELVLQSLPFIDWPDFNDKWGAEGWAALLPVIALPVQAKGAYTAPNRTECGRTSTPTISSTETCMS
jgi:hypothetical protein